VSLESLRRGRIPPTATSGDPDPTCDVDLVTGGPRDSDACVAVSISAGFGGINGALLLALQAPDDAPAKPTQRDVCIRATAVWIAGRWITSLDELVCESPALPEMIDLGVLASSRRLQRADRVTRLGAMAAARALADLEPCANSSVAAASALATAHTNEAWERRRQQGGRLDPRVFAYTATNAMAGELATALQARGPCIALLGSGEASLAALEQARNWVARGQCDRAIVVACECPPEDLTVTRVACVACCAALVLEPAGATSSRSLRLAWRAAGYADQRTLSRLLSVEPLARIALAPGPCTVTAKSAVGAWIDAFVGE